MRIAFIIYGDMNDISGGYVYNRALVAYLQQRGHWVDIIRLPLRSYWRHLLDNITGISRQRILDGNFDIVIEDEWTHPSLLRLNRWLRRRHIPVITLIHLLASFDAHAWYKTWFYRFIERFYLKAVDGMIVNSQLTLIQVQHLLARNCSPKKIPAHCVALPAGDNFQGVSVNVDIIRQRALITASLRILVVGNVIRRKGLHVLIKALAHLPAGQYRVVVAGRLDMELDYVAEIRHLLHDLSLEVYFSLEGPVQGDALARLYQQHHVMVLPSAYESYGIVYVEAQQFGLPVIGTWEGAANAIIQPGINGYLISPEDDHALAGLLQILHQQRELLIQLSENALDYFSRHPTWDHSGNIILQFFQQFLPAKRDA